jgi:hypothetical protein
MTMKGHHQGGGHHHDRNESFCLSCQQDADDNCTEQVGQRKGQAIKGCNHALLSPRDTFGQYGCQGIQHKIQTYLQSDDSRQELGLTVCSFNQPIAGQGAGQANRHPQRPAAGPVTCAVAQNAGQHPSDPGSQSAPECDLA